MAANTKSKGNARPRPRPISVAEALAERRRTRQSIVLTVNGAEFVVGDDGSVARLIELVERLETMDGLREALREVDSGRSLTLDEFKAHVKRKHGIPN